jgi:hypothetical protein
MYADDNPTVNRWQVIQATKARAAKRRLLPDGKPRCDMCGVVAGSQRHHIYTKYLTMGNDEARRLANAYIVNALLCQTCHDEADMVESRNRLFRLLYELHGYDTIRTQHNLIDQALRTGVGWTLTEPDKDEEDGKKER